MAAKIAIQAWGTSMRDSSSPGQNHQAALRNETRNIIKAALPAGVGRLILGREAGDVKAIGSDIVRGGAKGHHQEESHRVPEVAR